MKKKISMMLIVLLVGYFYVANYANAESYCRSINRTGDVVNSSKLADAMNRLLGQKGVDYRTSEKEVTSTIKSFCKSNPHADSNDATSI